MSDGTNRHPIGSAIAGAAAVILVAGMLDLVSESASTTVPRSMPEALETLSASSVEGWAADALRSDERLECWPNH